MLVQNSLAMHLILTFVGIIRLINQEKVLACQVYPSEYAYRDDSVIRTESDSANCRRYPVNPNLPREHHYIHCDGTKLKLIDNNLGQEPHQNSDYYQWSAGSDGQLLFIFPTRVSLTTITLHYYSDSDQGRPRLRFYAVTDHFNVWVALNSSTPYVGIASVPAGGVPAGRRSVSVNVNFNTKKVLMYKYSSSFQLAVSEAQFLHTCTISNSTMTETPPAITPVSTTVYMLINTTGPLKDALTKAMSTTPSFTTDTKTSIDKLNSSIEIIATVVSLGILSIILIITVVVLIWSYKRRSVRHKLNVDDKYSTLNRASRQTQQQTTQQDSTELYDKIHLSPSTGQTEFIPKPQSENTNNPAYNSHPTHPDSMNNATAASQTNSPMATYAAIDKSNKKAKKDSEDDTKHIAAENYTQRVSSSRGAHADNSTKRSQKSLDDTYAPDHQNQERVNSEQESNPPHSVEELYTAVKKKPKGSSATVNESVPQMAEDLYTAVMKKSKENSINDEVVPPVPPHTVEELYAAVHKKPAGNVMEDEEEAPPIPPLTVEDTL